MKKFSKHYRIYCFAIACLKFGAVEKSCQQRSRPFPVLTSCQDAPRVKMAAALLDSFFNRPEPVDRPRLLGEI